MLKMKTKIITLLLVLANVSFAQVFKFEFKDGTRLYANIYNGDKVTPWGGPNQHGLILTVNGRYYIHHYPMASKFINTNSYPSSSSSSMADEFIPEPPREEYLNPPPLPTCSPARINYIQFSKQTLTSLHKHLEKNHTFSMKAKYASRANTLNSIRESINFRPVEKLRRTEEAHLAWKKEAYEDFFKHRNKIFWGGWLENGGKDIDFPDPLKFPDLPTRVDPALFPLDSPLRSLIPPLTPMQKKANKAIQDSNTAMQQFLADKDRQKRIRELKTNYLLHNSP